MGIKPLAQDEIEFQKWSTDVGRYVTVRRKGKLYSLGGVTLALFPVPVIAEAMDRDVQSLRRWERSKVFPKPQWKTPDKRCLRWYSFRQVMFVHDLHREMSKGQHGFSHSAYFDLKLFLTRIRDEFYKLDATAVMQKGDAV